MWRKMSRIMYYNSHMLSLCLTWTGLSDGSAGPAGRGGRPLLSGPAGSGGTLHQQPCERHCYSTHCPIPFGAAQYTGTSLIVNVRTRVPSQCDF